MIRYFSFALAAAMGTSALGVTPRSALAAAPHQQSRPAASCSVAPGFHPLEWVRTAWAFLRLKNVRLVQQRLYRFVLQNLRLSHLRKFGTVTEAHYWAQLSYRPQPYAGRAVLFRAANTGSSYRRSLGWDRFLNAGLDICMLPAGHGAMVKEPMVRVLAEKLEPYLAGVGPLFPGQEIRPELVDA